MRTKATRLKPNEGYFCEAPLRHPRGEQNWCNRKAKWMIGQEGFAFCTQHLPTEYRCG